MADLRKKSSISEDDIQMEFNESTKDFCNAEKTSRGKTLSLNEYANSSDDKKKHVTPLSYECGDCSQNYRKPGLLFKHSNEQHGGRKCPECDKRFNSTSPYHVHINKHSGLRFSCTKCVSSYNTKANLTTHTNIHLGIKPHQCSRCEKSFSDRSACMRHEKLHSRGKTFCSVCGKGLAVASRLEEHMKTHEARKFSREEKLEAVALARKLGVREASDQLQVLTSTLTNWVKLDSRPVHCTQCSYTTYTASRLGEHVKNSHSSGERLYCQLCAARSNNKESLKKHMRRTHDNDIVKTEEGTKLQDMKTSVKTSVKISNKSFENT